MGKKQNLKLKTQILKLQVKSKGKNKHIISAVIITKNEEQNIVQVIKNLSFADEIIVVDNDSGDRTAELARKNGARVYIKKFDNFSQQRNFALAKAEGEWILYIDADERISKRLKNEILNVINNKNSPPITHYLLHRKNYYYGKYEWPYIEKIKRLFRKKKLKGWSGAIHESPVVIGKGGELDEYLLHYTHTDLSSMVKKTNAWSEIEAELLYNAGHPKVVWWRFIRIMLTKFYNSFVVQGGWKVGWVGWIESIYQAFSYFIVYAKLWERQSRKNTNYTNKDRFNK